MSKSLDDRLAQLGDEAEAGEADQTDRPIPAHVKVTRGNARSKVLQVRLNEDEFAAIERIAARRELPASTVAREQLLKLIAADETDDPATALAQIQAAAEAIKTLTVYLVDTCPEAHRETYRRVRGQLKPRLCEKCKKDDFAPAWE